jgi:hypothetical protein
MSFPSSSEVTVCFNTSRAQWGWNIKLYSQQPVFQMQIVQITETQMCGVCFRFWFAFSPCLRTCLVKIFSYYDYYYYDYDYYHYHHHHHLLSRVFFLPWYFSSWAHHSGFKSQLVALSLWCVMFLVWQFFVRNLLSSSKGYWRWCIAFLYLVYSDIIHRPI